MRAIEPDDINVTKLMPMSNWVTTNRYSYDGPLGEVSHSGRYFFAWKKGFLIGTYSTFDEAMECLVWRERLKTAI